MNIMKKVIFTLGMVLMGLAVQAQQWSIGPVVGVNHSWMSNMENDKGKLGFNAGVILNYSNFEHLGLGLGVSYSREGVVQEVNGTDVNTTLDYVRIPLKFSIYLNDMEDNFRPKFYIGPQVGFLVGGKTEMFSENGVTESNSVDVFDKTDLGVVMGAGFNYRVAEATWLNLDLAYGVGLKDVAPNLDSKNRNVSLNMGVAFGF
jgi:hypothetical protein